MLEIKLWIISILTHYSYHWTRTSSNFWAFEGFYKYECSSLILCDPVRDPWITKNSNVIYKIQRISLTIALKPKWKCKHFALLHYIYQMDWKWWIYPCNNRNLEYWSKNKRILIDWLCQIEFSAQSMQSIRVNGPGLNSWNQTNLCGAWTSSIYPSNQINAQQESTPVGGVPPAIRLTEALQ